MARPKTALAAWIREQRGAAGWKSEELARRLGVSESTVRGWESGRAVGWDKLEAMERLFGLQAPDKERGEAPTDLASLLAKMDAQTDAIQAAAEAIRSLALALAPALQQIEALEAEINALRAEVRTHHPVGANAASAAPHVPHETKE